MNKQINKKNLGELIEVNMILGKHENCLKALEQFPMNSFGQSLSFDIKAKAMIKMLNDCYIKTCEEIKGLFTKNEFMVVASALNTLLYNSNSNDNTLLYHEVKDAIDSQELDKKFGIDAEELLRKIYNLTEFQSFCVIRKGFEFWNQN